MIAEMTDNFIPTEEQPRFLAEGSYYLAIAIYELARDTGISLEEKQKTGEEAIVHARQALELHTQLFGTESAKVALSMGVLADALDHFNDVDDDEVLRLYEQSKAIISRVQGSSSMNVAAGENKSGNAYHNRANRALDANDLDRCMTNLELALPHFRESARIYEAINHIDAADTSRLNIANVEENIRRIRIDRAATRG